MLLIHISISLLCSKNIWSAYNQESSHRSKAETADSPSDAVANAVKLKQVAIAEGTAVDGRNPANQLIGQVVYPSIWISFLHPRFCLVFQ